ALALSARPAWRLAERKALLQSVRAVDVPLLHAVLARDVDCLPIAADDARRDGSQSMAITDAAKVEADIGLVVEGDANALFGDVSVIARRRIGRMPGRAPQRRRFGAADAEARLVHGGLQGIVLPVLLQTVERRRAMQRLFFGFLSGDGASFKPPRAGD